MSLTYAFPCKSSSFPEDPSPGEGPHEALAQPADLWQRPDSLKPGVQIPESQASIISTIPITSLPLAKL